MEIKRCVTEDALTGATLLLKKYCPELEPDKLVQAIQNYQPGTPAQRQEKPLTKKQAAECLGVSLPTIDRWLKRGVIRYVKLGGTTVRIDPQSVKEALQPATGQPEA